ncbi:discoidin domain-containing protein [Bradyrhizobium daqingense]|uniref:discoidin domain-containing protein n=1 Tax=Bradyrhizobium daqingense TaxID=993502 RepID=UPI0011A61CBA|nr:discoidin domain-containing protein [Bradyrhizobium daqingense]
MVLETGQVKRSGLIKPLIAALRAEDGLSKGVILVSLLLVVFAYLPTLQFDYATQDQWRAFRYSTVPQSALDRGQACATMIPSFYVLTGRPFVWMTECIEHAAVARIADFAYLRPIMLAVALATVMYLGFVLAPILGGMAFGTLAAAAMVLTPAYSFMFLQGLPAGMVLIAPILAAASFHLYSGRNREPRRKQKAVAISFCLFLSACLIYPAYAFIVVPLALLEFGFDLAESLSNRLKNLVSTLGFYFGACLFYYGLVKVTVSFIERKAGDLPVGYEVAVQLGSVLLHQAKVAAIHFVNMSPFDFSSPPGLSLVILVAFCGSLAWLGSRAPKGGHSVLTVSLSFLIISLVVLFAAISPWLFSPSQALASRHVLPWNLFFCGATVGLLSLLLRRYPATARWAPAILLFGGFLPIAWIQNQQSKLETVVTGAEIQLMRDKLSDWLDMKGWINSRHLLVVVPIRPRPPSAEKELSPQFGNENAVLATSRNPVGIPWMINALLRERADYPGVPVEYCGSDQACVNYALASSKSVVVSFSSGAEVIYGPVKPYIMDFSRMTAEPITPSVVGVKISATSVLGEYGPGGLFWSAQPGWHASRYPTYPQVITVEFTDAKSFSSVSFESQNGLVERMPKEVRIKISDDGSAWTSIASVGDICALDDLRGWRTVKIPERVRSRFLQIEILSNCGHPDILTLKGLKVE